MVVGQVAKAGWPAKHSQIQAFESGDGYFKVSACHADVPKARHNVLIIDCVSSSQSVCRPSDDIDDRCRPRNHALYQLRKEVHVRGDLYRRKVAEQQSGFRYEIKGCLGGTLSTSPMIKTRPSSAVMLMRLRNKEPCVFHLVAIHSRHSPIGHND